MHKEEYKKEYGQINLGKNNLVESINEKSNSGRIRINKYRNIYNT